MKNNLNSYSRQDLIHKLFDAYDNIFKAHWAIFSIKLILLITSFIIAFVLLSNSKKLTIEIVKRLSN